jgi:pSer/pThr/pTyr-binding forkhead associated (FHA) protein
VRDRGSDAAPAVRSRLEVVAGPASGTTIAVPETLTIGRGEAQPGGLGDDPELSRMHARIDTTNLGLLIEDLDSTNGTFVNGGRIRAPTLLGEGDEIVVGTTTLRVTAEAPPAPAQPPARERRPALRVVEGWAIGALIPIGDGPTALGRRGVAESALGHDEGVAEDHAKVSPTTSGGVVLEDLGSDSGTLVGGRPIPAPTLLQPGDRFQVGGSVLEVVLAAGDVATAGATSRAVSSGGVHAPPGELFRLIGARAPVTRGQVAQVAGVALVLGFAANYVAREVAIRVFDVPSDIASLRLVPWVLQTVLPVVGNSIGFYKIFRRPDEESVKRYLAPTFGVPVVFVIVQMFRLEEHTAMNIAATIVLTVQSLVICAVLMLRLRARVARAQVAATRGKEVTD